jgi:hypothetical protein
MQPQVIHQFMAELERDYEERCAARAPDSLWSIVDFVESWSFKTLGSYIVQLSNEMYFNSSYDPLFVPRITLLLAPCLKQVFRKGKIYSLLSVV